MPPSMSGLVQLRGSTKAPPGGAPAREAARAPAASVYLETYGCQMNVADTELMLGLLQQAGYARAADPAAADLIRSTRAPSARRRRSASTPTPARWPATSTGPASSWGSPAAWPST